ncbi:glycosyltransferase family 4 protein [Iodobacter fluviatilis]|uniref:GDP-mannose-dependent alpha-(1-6)-phosphatidylinositol monomannoside mannosyltransferase n=1 Tax=Iodobacter fluviatilis TaxID=537 RepID=A0A377SYS9_9NEIS|nr:glycosyltransferase family 1 protein [Iodobacter fluviatilis]TCU87985.1 glycosyltransferase involved in cell wall biosynthesis [Iodobacter fluviatilis]STR45486.1 GDP-mannose-dependent alpha-(1-6)-phosphatidylinositol monomannoside mannosyltransferase [Iodobacter fluviatilis]
MLYINGKFTSQKITGVQRFARSLVCALDAFLFSICDKNHVPKVILLCPIGASPPKLKYINVEYSGSLISGHLWEQLVLPFASRRGILINFSGSAPIFKMGQICAIHDAAIYDHPTAYTKLFRLWYSVLFRILGKTSKLILTVSEFSKCRLQKFINVSEEDISVLYNGSGHITGVISDVNVLQKFGINAKEYIFAVGSLNPTKNLSNLLTAFKEISEKLNVTLVVAGGCNTSVFQSNFDSSSPFERVKFIGYIPDEELKALYENALAFVFPSTYEGFGIPPLEAMECGCPVIASNLASIPEVCGDAAYYFDPLDIASITEAIEEIIANSKLREKLVIKGFERVAFFDWNHTAKKLFNDLKKIGVL